MSRCMIYWVPEAEAVVVVVVGKRCRSSKSCFRRLALICLESRCLRLKMGAARSGT